MSRTASELTNEEIELVEQLSDVANENYVYRDVNGDFIGVPWGGGGGSGDVNWPVSATANNFASFNGVTGKIIQDSGLNQASFAAALWADDNYVTDAQLAVINNTSGTNTGDQDLSSYATISYTDWLVVGLLDDRGSYNASSNLFPTTWGSGTAGAVMKWDLWTVSTGGTLWWVAVTTGDVFRALADTPWQTASNWTVTENNLWYVPENSVNKSTTLSADQASNTKFPSVKSVYDWAVWLFATISSLTSHTGNTSNPHSVTKAQVGLWNVDNTSDATKDSATATLTNKTLWTTQLGEVSIKYDALLSADEKRNWDTTAGIAGATIAVGKLCYLASSNRWLLTDWIVDWTHTGFDKILWICVLASTDTNPTEILLKGKIRSAAFPSFATIWAPIYMSNTAWEVTQTKPSTSNHAIRKLWFALTADDWFFNPSNDYIVNT